MADLVSSVFKGGGFIDITPYQYGREVCGPGYAFGPARRSHYRSEEHTSELQSR